MLVARGGARVAGFAPELEGGEDKLLLLLCGEDFVKIDRNAEGDEEEAADARDFPVRGL